MKKQLRSFIIPLLLCSARLYSQNAPSIEWQKSLGGSRADRASSIEQTTDGGFIVAGYSYSDDGDVSGHHCCVGYCDYWIVKLDSSGNIQWQKSLGGKYEDAAYSIQQTTDGGFIVAGNSSCNDGDVSGHHGDTMFSADYWIVKLDTSGNIQWQKSLGGSGDERAYSIQQTTNGGFIVGGWSSSNDGDVSGNHNACCGSDYWIVKLNSSGDIQGKKCFGGIDGDGATSIQQTTDGRLIIAGSSGSNDGDVSGHHGSTLCSDYWIVKLDSSAGIQWQKSLGGSGYDDANSIQQTTDGGFIVAGETGSSDGDVSGQHGGFDYWIVKLDSSGNIQWQKCSGGSAWDQAYSIQQTTDGGYIVAGNSLSNDGDASSYHGGVIYGDYWIVKLDSTGNLQWQKSLGGSGDERAYCIQQTTNGGYIVAGYSLSNDGDVTGHHDSTLYADYWIVKLSNDIALASPSLADVKMFSVFPNPTSTTITLSLPSNQNAILSIFNLLGEKVKEEKVTGKQVTLDVSSLPQGLYLVRAENGVVGKFVKE